MAVQKDVLSIQASSRDASSFRFCLSWTFDKIVRKCTHDNRGIKWSEARTLKDLYFSDDLALFCHTFEDQ